MNPIDVLGEPPEWIYFMIIIYMLVLPIGFGVYMCYLSWRLSKDNI